MERALDLVVVAVVLAGVTVLGQRLSGSIVDRRGFFQAGGSLPWWAVSASIIATLVSSVTFVSVPAAVFRDGGNLSYFQLILGLALGKIAIALVLARAFYESRGVESTYEYIGARTDRATGEFSMGLGLLLGVINSGVKLLTASLVLDVITGWGLAVCALTVLAVSMLWSLLAGIKTVIWTDFLMFVLFTLGALFALSFMLLGIDRSLSDSLLWLDAQAKLALFDFSTDPQIRYTIWSGIVGGIALNLAQASTQGTWQRVRACRSYVQAYRAYAWAAAFYVMHLLVLGVGLALAVYYAESGLPADVAAAVAAEPDRIFPFFIANDLPAGISGLFMAAIFAAAISTLDSALTESADVSVRHIYQPLVRQRSERHYLLASRLAVVFWGLVFVAVALFFSRYTAQGLLDLTFKLPNYLYGAIFATIMLARFGIGRFPHFVVGFALACALVAWLSQAQVAFLWWCPLSGSAMFACVWLLSRQRPRADGGVHVAAVVPTSSQ